MSRYTREHVDIAAARFPRARLARLGKLYPSRRWIPQFDPHALAFVLAFALFALIAVISAVVVITFSSNYAARIWLLVNG